MDREDRAGAAHGGVRENRAQVHRHQTGLPVVAVDDVGRPVQKVQRGQGGLAEIAVFGNVLDQIGVGIAPAEKLVVVDEVVDHAVHLHLHDAHIEAPSVCAEIHHEVALIDHPLLILLGDALVARQDDLHVAVEPGQRPGQGVHDVAEAARLHKGIALRADKGHAAARLRNVVHRRFRGLGLGFFRRSLCLFLCWHFLFSSRWQNGRCGGARVICYYYG